MFFHHIGANPPRERLFNCIDHFCIYLKYPYYYDGLTDGLILGEIDTDTLGLVEGLTLTEGLIPP
uniref:Uncharacterized protein n=1 Tax=viral metagenome TaxID=1070528 RepID=A0A6M3IQC2_9ZZZZ